MSDGQASKEMVSLMSNVASTLESVRTVLLRCGDKCIANGFSGRCGEVDGSPEGFARQCGCEYWLWL